MTATRQGKVRVQAAHSAARIRRHRPWAEPPGWPTLARTRSATTGCRYCGPRCALASSQPSRRCWCWRNSRSRSWARLACWVATASPPGSCAGWSLLRRHQRSIPPGWRPAVAGGQPGLRRPAHGGR
jgi:hypothetical protein